VEDGGDLGGFVGGPLCGVAVFEGFCSSALGVGGCGELGVEVDPVEGEAVEVESDVVGVGRFGFFGCGHW